MSRHDLRRLVLERYSWSVEIATRFGDLDVNRHLNNVAIARLFEEARVRFNWHLRASYPAVGHPRFLVARTAIDYLGEGGYPAPATVGLAVQSVGKTSYLNAMALFQGGSCIALGETVMVHRGEGGAAPLPDALRATLGEFVLRP